MAAAVWRYTAAAGVSDPGVGNLQFNQTILSIASVLAISATDADGHDLTAVLLAVAATNPLTFHKAGTPGEFAQFTATGAATAHGTWVEIPVAFQASSGFPATTGERIVVDELLVPLGPGTTVFPPGSYPAAVVSDGAVAYWRLNEASGTTAGDSIGSAHGTISGGVTLGQAGALADGSTAMAFNGTDGKVVAPKGTYSDFGTGPLSVEWWFYRTASATNRYVCACNSGHVRGFDAYLDGSQNPIFRVWNTATSYVRASTTPTLNQWHHVVAVVRRGASDVLEIYVDGVADGTQTLPAAGWDLTSSSFCAVGDSHFSAASDHWNGSLDEVAIYKTALTPTQIANHYALRTATLWTPMPQASLNDNLKAYLEQKHIPSHFAAADLATLIQYDLSLRTGDYTSRFQAMLVDAVTPS